MPQTPAALLAALPPYVMPAQVAVAIRRRLAEMLEEFQEPVFSEILAAFRGDLRALAEGLVSTEGEPLARHGHVLTALAGELGAIEISERGRDIEQYKNADFARDTAVMILSLLEVLDHGDQA